MKPLQVHDEYVRVCNRATTPEPEQEMERQYDDAPF
jgi:hypothetical protein